MMKFNRLIKASCLAGAILITNSCEDFLDVKPQGVVDKNQMATESGILSILVGAYANLDGSNTVGWAGGHSPDAFMISSSGWIYGEVVSDNAHKGSELDDQEPIKNLEIFTADASNSYLNPQWIIYYDGVARANDVLRTIAVGSGLSSEFVKVVSAEARVLRGFYHFEAKKIWGNVPYLGESAPADGKVSNTVDIWPQIEADFAAGVADLPETQESVGRVTSWVAKALLAKAHMYQADYDAALPILNDIIDNGPFDLVDDYQKLWNIPSEENNEESIFSFQASALDGAGTNWNGMFGDVLNGIDGGPGNCCGFFVPTQNLVNSYKTENGLPMLDDFNDADVTSDAGLTAADPFTPYAGTLDPRLDHTVGRRGIPFLDYGVHPGDPWVRDPNFAFGSFSNKKRFIRASDVGSANTADWTGYASSMNYNFIRFADVLLWAAECEVEVGTLSKALAHVNRVRQRAIDAPVVMNGANPAANYDIDLYGSFPDKDFARKAVRFERRLELAMEGHRFFDLNRWGVTAQVMNDYIAEEKTKRAFLSEATFVAPRNIYQPIPEEQINLSVKDGAATLVQNPGYN